MPIFNLTHFQFPSAAALIKVFISQKMVYTCSVLLGAGAAIIWVSMGFMLSSNSEQNTFYRLNTVSKKKNPLVKLVDKQTFFPGTPDINRNVGMFWSLFHFSGILGNISVVFVSRIQKSAQQLVRKRFKININQWNCPFFWDTSTPSISDKCMTNVFWSYVFLFFLYYLPPLLIWLVVRYFTTLYWTLTTIQ